jgi:hypothetical protein
MNIPSLILVLIVSIIIHELGHIIAYLLYGLKPSVKLKWYLAIEIGEEHLMNLTPIQLGWIGWAGIWAGAIPIVIWFSSTLGILYLLLCAIDITTLITLSKCPRNLRNKPLINYVRHNYKQALQAYRAQRQKQNTGGIA